MLLNPLYTKAKQPLKLGLIDEYIEASEPLRPFALADGILNQMNKGELAADACLYYWPGAPCVYLGMVDTRLPKFDAGIQLLEENGYAPVVRPSGGLAVVNDPGILNLTLAVRPDQGRLSIDHAYDLMVNILNELLKPYGEAVQTGEVPDSYCPGTYDLRVQGKKVAGLSQRRIGDTVGLYIYLSLNGPQQERGELLRKFYEVTEADTSEKTSYPAINPASMANLGDLIPELSDLETVKEKFTQTLIQADQLQLVGLETASLDDEKYLKKMQKKNRQVKKALGQ